MKRCFSVQRPDQLALVAAVFLDCCLHSHRDLFHRLAFGRSRTCLGVLFGDKFGVRVGSDRKRSPFRRVLDFANDRGRSTSARPTGSLVPATDRKGSLRPLWPAATAQPEAVIKIEDAVTRHW